MTTPEEFFKAEIREWSRLSMLPVRVVLNMSDLAVLGARGGCLSYLDTGTATCFGCPIRHRTGWHLCCGTPRPLAEYFFRSRNAADFFYAAIRHVRYLMRVAHEDYDIHPRITRQWVKEGEEEAG